MSVFIHQIATAVPEIPIPQDIIRDAIKAGFAEGEHADRRLERLAHRIYSQSGITTRHTVIPDFDLENPYSGQFYDQQTGKFKVPSTQFRNELYTEKSKPMFTKVAQDVLEATEGLDSSDVTHVITVSCTGFYAPGPDYVLVKSLGLPASTERYHIGFMGCFAAFPALKLAKTICDANPDATVLVVCLELCTLHFQPSTDMDGIISTSVFSDGASAAIVSARQPAEKQAVLEMTQFASALTPTGEEDMAWTIGNTGFDIVLSSYVPSIIEANIEEAIAPLLEQYELEKEDIDSWAVHPGGRAILDKVIKGLSLEKDALDSAREVLNNYGNMSSATIMFVLKSLLQAPLEKEEETIYAMAFGPGLTVESGLFSKQVF